VRKGEQALAAPPSALVLAAVLMVFGYGQRLVMAPLSSVVLSTVKPSSAGAGLRNVRYDDADRQRGRSSSDRCGIFRDQATGSAQLALFAACVLFALSIIICAAFLSWMRRACACHALTC
jgi:hypothetical protein